MKEVIMTSENLQVSGDDLVDILRQTSEIKRVLQEIIIERELTKVVLEDEVTLNLRREFFNSIGLNKKEDQEKWISSNFMDERILMKRITRPTKVLKYREERWGHLAKDLYLKNRDNYEQYTFNIIQSRSPDLLQEIYYRIKDEGLSWSEASRMVSSNNKESRTKVGPISAKELDPEIIRNFKDRQRNKIIGPIQLKNEYCIAEVIEIIKPKFTDKVKAEIISEQFREWLAETYAKTCKSIKFKSSSK